MSMGEIFGYIASILVFATFYMKTMVRLRLVAIPTGLGSYARRVSIVVELRAVEAIVTIHGSTEFAPFALFERWAR